VVLRFGFVLENWLRFRKNGRGRKLLVPNREFTPRHSPATPNLIAKMVYCVCLRNSAEGWVWEIIKIK